VFFDDYANALIVGNTEMALHHGLLTLSSNPSKWRRVLTTLSAELEKFKSNPHYYSDPVFYNPPEV